MQEFFIEIKKTLVQLCLLLLLTVSSSGFLGHVELIPGLILGSIASILYYLFICYRVRKSADLPVIKAVMYMRTGWLVRLSFILIVLVLSLKIPQINFGAAVAGLFSLQIVLFFKAVILIFKNITTKEYKW